MYSDHDPCAVCGAEIRLLPNPGVPAAGTDRPAGPEDGVVGGGDSPVDVRTCTNSQCPSQQPDGPAA